MSTRDGEFSVAKEFVRRWIERFYIVAESTNKNDDYRLIEELMDPNMTFCSPVVFKPYTNAKDIRQILRNVEDLFQNFRYKRVMYEDDGLGCALMFTATIQTDKGPLEVDGVDFFKLNKEGKAVQLKVMIRPLATTMEVAKLMMKRIMSGKFADDERTQPVSKL